MAYRSIRFFLVGLAVTSCSGATTAMPSNDGGTSDAGSSSSGSDAGAGGSDASSSNDPPASPCSALHTPVPPTNGGSSGGISASLTLLPGNLMTAAAAMPIGARENQVPPDYGPPSIDGVVLELRDCATNTVIPSTVTHSSSEPPSYLPGGLVLTPNAPLPEAWYQLAVTAVPEHIVAPAPISFHTGSHPLVTGLRYCVKADGVVRAGVLFSEPVTGTGNAVKLEQDSKVCTYVDGIPGSAVTVDCRGFAGAAPVHLKVNEGLASPRGIGVTFETTIDLAKLTEESGCLVWRRQ